MAEYYALLARAVAALRRNDEASRREIYVKARSALIKQLKAIAPPLPAAEISKQRLALEEGIRRVEKEAVEAAAAAMLSEEEIERQAVQALEAALAPQPDEVSDDTAEPFEPADPELPEPEAVSPRTAPPEGAAPAPDEAYAEVVTPVRLRPIGRRAPPVPTWERAATVTDVEEPPERPAARRSPAVTRSPRSGGRGWERAPKRSASTRIAFWAVVVLIIGATGYFGWTERDRVTDFVNSLLGNETEEAETVDADDAAGEEVAGEEVAGEVVGEEVAAVIEEPPVFVDPAAVFYEEADNVASPKADATVAWALVEQDGNTTIVANLSVPDRGLMLTLEIARVGDGQISHQVTILVTNDAGFDVAPIQSVENMTVKSTEEGIGVGLDASAVGADGVYFLDLPVDFERQNTTRLRTSPWFDLLLVYESGERAIISFSKGTPGNEIFIEAFEAWDI